MEVKVLDLLGKTLTSIKGSKDDAEVSFVTTEGDVYTMLHEQECCECVLLDDICGDLDDLIGNPILMAEEVTNFEDTFGRELDESFTWTFYKFATIKGYVTLKWFGTSNGYYSESVSIYKNREE